MIKKLYLLFNFYSFYSQILYIISLLFSNNNSLFYLTIYINTWLICIFGNIITYEAGKEIFKIYNIHTDYIPLCYILHTLPIITLLLYKPINKNYKLALYYILILYTTYLFYLKFKNLTIYDIYTYKSKKYMIFNIIIFLFLILKIDK